VKLTAILSFLKRTLIVSTFFFIARPVYAQGTVLVFCGDNAIQTAVGCIGTNPTDLIAKITANGIGLGGCIAFLMILRASVQMQISAGNPERINQGRELLESAISGLLLIIFSVFILRVIGVNILGIPGFN